MAKEAVTDRQFYELVELLHPYLGQIVIIGGWAMYVYRVFLDPSGPMPMTTSDLDIAAPGPLKPSGSDVDLAAGGPIKASVPSIEDLFEKKGYELVPFSGNEPAITKFEKKGEPEVEFLLPLKGQGGNDSMRLQGNIVAVCKRYLDVVVQNPVRVDISAAIGKTPGSLAIRVPMPSAYLFHKGLSFVQRSDKVKKSKDLAYMFELMNNFPKLRPDLLPGIAKLGHPASWKKTFRKNLEPLFKDLGSPGIQMVASQQPHPYQEMVRNDPTNGPVQFENLVLATFREMLRAVL